jgi:hypothetical protein
MKNGVNHAMMVHPAMAEYVARPMGEYIAQNGMGGVGLGTASILAWGGLFAGAYIGYKYSKKWRVAKAIGLGLLGNYAGAMIGASFAVQDPA